MLIAKFTITTDDKEPFVSLIFVALILQSMVAIPAQIAGQTATPDQTPPVSPAGIPPQPPARPQSYRHLRHLIARPLETTVSKYRQ